MKKKNQCIAMLLSLCFTLSMPQMYYASTAKRKSAPGTAIFVMAEIQNLPVVNDITFNLQKDGLKLEMHIPQFSYLSDDQFQNQLNHTLLKQAKARKKAIIHEEKSLNKEVIQNQLTPIPFEYIETFKVVPSEYPYYALENAYYKYSGGAHGITNLNYLNINLKTNQIVALSDLFKDQKDYISIINEHVQEEINRRSALGEFFFTGTDGFQTIRKNQPFWVNEKGNLVIVFNVYEIAPYASGPIYIELSKEDLRPYLK